MSGEDDLGDLRSSLESTDRVIAGIGADQWDNPTPCDEWNVGQLLDHLVAGNMHVATALGGKESSDVVSGTSGDRRLEGFRSSADALVEAFERPGALSEMVTVPFGTVPGTMALSLRITEILVHGWDLARSTGLEVAFPDGAVGAALAFSRIAIERVPPGRRPFAPPREAPVDAPLIDQLAALLGRDPG